MGGPRSPPRWTASSLPGLQARPPDGVAMRGPWRALERPFALEPEPPVEGRSPSNLYSLCSNQSATVPCSASSSPTSSTPPCRNAKERGCSTGKMSLWKPWTAPHCFLCSRSFHAARHHLLAAVYRARGEHRSLHLVVDPAFEPRLDRAL
jgi:hypothetical protein